jgi:hypothetical protein
LFPAEKERIVKLLVEEVVVSKDGLLIRLRLNGLNSLVAAGNAGVPALHAAALAPSLFRPVKLSQTLVSWASMIHCRLTRLRHANVVHGAVLGYDLPNLAATLRDRLTVEDPRHGVGSPT